MVCYVSGYGYEMVRDVTGWCSQSDVL